MSLKNVDIELPEDYQGTQGMKMKCGAKHKFTVLNNAYLEGCDYQTRQNVEAAGLLIAWMRKNDGKDPYPEYIVINTDEPYADQIIDILKAHGHWG